MNYYEFEQTVLRYMENMKAQILARPLNLGGVSDSYGGSGGPPGGFTGKLPQGRVTYDTTEAETSVVPVSGATLVDNLNRIRRRIQILETVGVTTSSGIFLYSNGTLVASGVTGLNFVGATVSFDAPTGRIVVSGTTLSGTTGYVPKWSSASALGNSPIFISGDNVGVGTTSPTNTVSVSGSIGTTYGNYSVVIDPSSLTPILFTAEQANYITVRNYRNAAGGGGFQFNKARGTIASPAIVNASDTTMLVEGYGYDGYSFQNNANMSFGIDGTPSSGNMPGKIFFATRADGGTAVRNRASINADGTFAVLGNATDLVYPVLRLQDAKVTTWTGKEDAGSIDFYTADSATGTLAKVCVINAAGYNTTTPAYDVVFYNKRLTTTTDFTETMRINHNNKVIVGYQDLSPNYDGDYVFINTVNTFPNKFTTVGNIEAYTGDSFGSELVTNGTFSSVTGWTKTSCDYTVASGIATISEDLASRTGFAIYQAITTVSGMRYRISANLHESLCSNLSTAQLRVGPTANTATIAHVYTPTLGSDTNVMSTDFVAIGSTTYISLYGTSTASVVGVMAFSSVTVKEVQSGDIIARGLFTGGGSNGIKVTASGGVRIGDVSGGNYTEIESDGSLRFVGNATVYKDVFFPMAPPKTTGAGNPTLATISGFLRGYAFAVNDVHDFDPQEYPHDGMVGESVTWHIHWLSRTNVAATRGVKWELEYAWATPNGVLSTPATASIDVTVASNTAVNTHLLTDITTFTPSGVSPGSQFLARLKRTASATTAPASDPIVLGVHFHYKVDTVGSRDIIIK